jgi:hypothetical protein
MKRRYASFLVRCWQLDTDTQRVTVSHIQSGEQTASDALPAVFEWIASRAGGSATAGDATHPPAPDAPDPDGTAPSES